jgi:hypothetical protein
VAATLRASIAHLSPGARMVVRYRHYIATIEKLAEIFGPPDGHAAWLKVQTRQLRRMERALAKAGDDAGPVLDVRLCDLFMAAKPAQDEPPAIAG